MGACANCGVISRKIHLCGKGVSCLACRYFFSAPRGRGGAIIVISSCRPRCHSPAKPTHTKLSFIIHKDAAGKKQSQTLCQTHTIPCLKLSLGERNAQQNIGRQMTDGKIIKACKQKMLIF